MKRFTRKSDTLKRLLKKSDTLKRFAQKNDTLKRLPKKVTPYMYSIIEDKYDPQLTLEMFVCGRIFICTVLYNFLLQHTMEKSTRKQCTYTFVFPAALHG